MRGLYEGVCERDRERTRERDKERQTDRDEERKRECPARQREGERKRVWSVDANTSIQRDRYSHQDTPVERNASIQTRPPCRTQTERILHPGVELRANLK